MADAEKMETDTIDQAKESEAVAVAEQPDAPSEENDGQNVDDTGELKNAVPTEEEPANSDDNEHAGAEKGVDNEEEDSVFGFDKKRTIKVWDIVNATVSHTLISQFFSFCGRLSRVSLFNAPGQGMPLQALMSTPTERVVFALLEFVDASAREVAVLLDKTTLGAMTIRCAPVDEVEISESCVQMPIAGGLLPVPPPAPPLNPPNQGPASISVGGAPPLLSTSFNGGGLMPFPSPSPPGAVPTPQPQPSSQMNAVQGVLPGMPITVGGVQTTTTPTLTIPGRKPLTAEEQDQVARTVYVGNINATVTADQLVKIFSVCGKVTYCRLAGDATHPSRFAFIEYADQESSAKAIGLNGTMLLDRALKVNHSKNPIVKPMNVTPREETAIQRRLRRAQEAIMRRHKTDEDEDKKDNGSEKNERDSKRRRTRSRSRERRRSSRSRSRERRRERDRRDRDRRRPSSRERDKRRRSRSRDRRDRDRHRDRDRDRDRDRHRSKDRHRERDRNRERERSRDDKDRDTDKVRDRKGESSRDKKRHRKRSRSPSNESERKKEKEGKEERTVPNEETQSDENKQESDVKMDDVDVPMDSQNE